MSEAVRSSAIALLAGWRAPDPGQDALRHAVLAFLQARPDSCRRSCVPGHVTASALVLNAERDKALLTLHPRLGRWVQLGGHCEEEDTGITGAALREATEESGICGLRLLTGLAAIHVHPLTCSLGVPTRHLDLQFLAVAPPDAGFVVSAESLDLRWFGLDELPDEPGLAHLAAAARRDAADR